jgi:hypothetical protein
MLDRECPIGFPPIVTAALSSEAELRKERRSIKLSSCVDVMAARSLCYVNSIRFQFASAIECNNHPKPTSAIPRRKHA